MNKVISKLLLLALAVGICNAQVQPPARPNALPNRPGQQPNTAQARPNQPNRPNGPNVIPNGPTRQQAPITRPQNAPTRAPPAQNNKRPAQPNRPLPQNPQRPQQSPINRPNNAPTRATPGPGRPTPAPPAANVPRPNTQAPVPSPPAANVPTPGGGGGGNNPGTTTRQTTTTRRPTNDDNNEIDMANFPTAPTIAPTPEVIFVTTPRVPIQNPGQPNHPNIPITPWNPRLSEGRPDHRCPLNQDSRNPIHLPHDTDCGRFFKCDHGLAFEYRCPDGQHWNARRNYCDFPNNANCRPGGNHNINNGVPVIPHPPPSPQVPDWNPQWNLNNQHNWNNPNSNIVPWTNPPINSNPGSGNPIIIPMAPRS